MQCETHKVEMESDGGRSDRDGERFVSLFALTKHRLMKFPKNDTGMREFLAKKYGRRKR